jgi:soluble lytic murein transglycosylase-like protein
MHNSNSRSLKLFLSFLTSVGIAMIGLSTNSDARPVQSAAHQSTKPHRAASKSSRAPVSPKAVSTFAQEAAMNPRKLVDRWSGFINDAAKRMGIPGDWIRAVVMEESAGRTMLAESTPITSNMGAAGLMQLMPGTWREMQQIYKLGNNPYDPHDNILAGAAYLRSLYWEYGYPGLFAAYNDGPGMIESHRRLEQLLPAETMHYMLDIAEILRNNSAQRSHPLLESALPLQGVTSKTAPSPPQYAQDNDDNYYHEE